MAAADVRPQRAKLIFQMIVSPVDQARLIHLRFSLCPKPRQHQRGAAPQIPGRHPRAVKLLHAPHHGCATAAQDVCPHAVQFARVGESVLKYILHNHAGSFRHGQKRFCGLRIFHQALRADHFRAR